MDNDLTDNLGKCEKELTELEKNRTEELKKIKTLGRVDLIDELENITGAFATSWNCIGTESIQSILNSLKVKDLDNQRALALCKCASANKIEIPEDINSLSQLNLFMRRATGISKPMLY